MTRFYTDLNGERLFWSNCAAFKRDPDRYEVTLAPIGTHVGKPLSSTKLVGVGSTVVAAYSDLDARIEQELRR